MKDVITWHLLVLTNRSLSLFKMPEDPQKWFAWLNDSSESGKEYYNKLKSAESLEFAKIGNKDIYWNLQGNSNNKKEIKIAINMQDKQAIERRYNKSTDRSKDFSEPVLAIGAKVQIKDSTNSYEWVYLHVLTDYNR